MQTSGKECGGAFTPAARVPFLEHPSVVLSGPGPWRWEGRGPHRNSRRERRREGGEAGPGLEGGARGDPGSSGLWGPLRLPHFSLAGSPRG